MSALPFHVATDDEPIPALGPRPWDGPDMQAVVPIEQMLEWLRALNDDDVGYVTLWRNLVTSTGCSVLVSYERDGEQGLRVVIPCDAQIRHRSRWMHFLLEDLDRVESRRDVLTKQLLRERLKWDERPTDPAAVTLAIRDFLRTGGRILLTPDGQLEIGGEVPQAMLSGAPAELDACRRATRAYLDVRTRLNSDRQIKRAVRMLGSRTANGWIVLEASR